ncbi:MAG: PA0069 family radical SAM protein [Sandaracinus sp.]|nr:PA0069 family radical SAM protein [Sandaracinus sp.]MCB9618903.1 PA0069 family radical SAM protein [Sandaracinus sp.]MCB9633758.1 PA0069 family radical SAM protein [Sandaracinus sp.]
MRAVANPPNPFESAALEWEGPPPPAALQVFEERCRSAITENDSPDVGFRFGVNPYRGCFHACAYCYARPSHQYWGFGAGTDFDRKIVVKTNVAEKLREELRAKRWKGDPIVFSGNTDCYQPLEASYGLTRACLEACLEVRNPVGVITKSVLVRRDLDVLAKLSEVARAHVTVSIPFADDAMARAIEPFASPPSKRFETLRRLADVGVGCGVSLGPVIPGLNDDQLPEILERAKAAGASSAFLILLRLPREVREVFDARLQEAFPLRADKVRHAILEMRQGRMNDPRFGSRMRGHGPRWQLIETLFRTTTRRLGIDVHESSVDGSLSRETTYVRPLETTTRVRSKRQLTLFE